MCLVFVIIIVIRGRIFIVIIYFIIDKVNNLVIFVIIGRIVIIV